MAIHATAVVDPSAALGTDVEIGAYVVIEANTQVGDNCHLEAFSAVRQFTTLGARCHVHSGVILGGDPQDLKFHQERSYLRIGADNELREYVTIHRASGEENATTLGDGNLLMAYSHIGHNCTMGSHTLLANSVAVAGHCVIEDYVNIGGLAAIHQFVTVGTMSMVGGLSRIVRDVPPYTIVEGSPARPRGINVRGLQRHKISEETRDQLRRAYRLLFRSDYNVTAAIAKLRADEATPSPELLRLLDFMREIDLGSRGRQLNR
ncbi:MAG TPA: acyl-ACP--UDP-N-acetylglucosamine O-acyltransferase [Armatimonadota bacterium]|jgi:UDP-N-acetylglucosamine acyltransferase